MNKVELTLALFIIRELQVSICRWPSDKNRVETHLKGIEGQLIGNRGAFDSHTFYTDMLFSKQQTLFPLPKYHIDFRKPSQRHKLLVIVGLESTCYNFLACVIRIKENLWQRL